MQAYLVYNKNDTFIRILNIQDLVTGSYVSSGSGTCTVKRQDGSIVSGCNWPLPLSLENDQKGNYKIILPSTLELCSGETVIAHVDFISQSGDAHWEIPLLVETRRY